MIYESSKLFENFESMTADEAELINELIPIKSYKKGTILLREGQIAIDSYFILEGIIRSYYLIDGDERTTEFYTENQSCASLNSYVNQVPAKHYLECVEDCRLTVLNYKNEKELIKKYPKFESLCRVSLEDDYGKQQEKLASYITSSPEERYLKLLNTRPELIKRVPQYQLASYLGVKPESLSRIRKRISLRK